jgi:shikimate kinase
MLRFLRSGGGRQRRVAQYDFETGSSPLSNAPPEVDHPRRRIFLIGPMGAGKTTIGKRLADYLQMPFIDSDHEIERRSGVDIPFIFEKEGEAGFRRREQSTIADLSLREPVVLATGGGAVLDADTRRHLAARGFVVYLHASIAQQLERTGRADNRPLLTGTDRQATLETLFAVRDPLYREIAALVVETDARNARNAVRLIAEQFKRHVAAAHRA